MRVEKKVYLTHSIPKSIFDKSNLEMIQIFSKVYIESKISTEFLRYGNFSTHIQCPKQYLNNFSTFRTPKPHPFPTPKSRCSQWLSHQKKSKKSHRESQIETPATWSKLSFDKTTKKTNGKKMNNFSHHYHKEIIPCICLQSIKEIYTEQKKWSFEFAWRETAFFYVLFLLPLCELIF